MKPSINFFSECSIVVNGIPCPTPVETINYLREGAVLVDIREELETGIAAFGLEQVIYLPRTLFNEKWQSLPMNKPMILADSAGIWSGQCAIRLKQNGTSEVACLAGGFTEWMHDGLPVKKGRYAPLNGPCPCMIRTQKRK